MKRRFIVHAGNLKTGSSAIQRYLKRNLKSYEDISDILVPGLEIHTDAITFLAQAINFGSDISGGKYTWKALKSDVARSNKVQVLLTSENLIQVPARTLKENLDWVSANQADIYFYLRPHIGMATSNFAEVVKRGVFSDSPHSRVTALMHSRALNFVPAITDFANVFGFDSVHCREYARQHFTDGNVVNDFEEFFGLPRLKILDEDNKVLVANPTPGSEELGLLHFLGPYFANFKGGELEGHREQVFRAVREALDSILPQDYKTRYRLPKDVQEMVKGRFEAERLAFLDKFDFPKVSDEWKDEPVLAPAENQIIPCELIDRVLESAMKDLKARGNDFGQAMVAAFEDLPTVMNRGEKCVDIGSLPLFEGQISRSKDHALSLSAVAQKYKFKQPMPNIGPDGIARPEKHENVKSAVALELNQRLAKILFNSDMDARKLAGEEIDLAMHWKNERASYLKRANSLIARLHRNGIELVEKN